jgi:outer membrane protein OmpA-like peptidoglycan-associated protein
VSNKAQALLKVAEGPSPRDMQRLGLSNAVTATFVYLVIALSQIARGQIDQQADSTDRQVHHNNQAEHRPPAFTFAEGERYAIDMAGSSLTPNTRGTVQVKHENGRSSLKLRMQGIVHPQSIGAAYTTYLLWAATPDGQASSIAELPVRNSVTFTGTTPLQSFGLMITAEPYSAVTVPGSAVVAENVVPDADRTSQSTTEKSVRTSSGSLVSESAGEADYETRLPLLGARRAVAVAGQTRAQLYAPEAWQDSQNRLAELERSWSALKPDQGRFVRQFSTPAHELMRSAERARQLSIADALEAQRRAEESTARALDAARRVAFEAAVKARDELVHARQEADAARARAEQAQTDAEREKTSAELARTEAAVTRADAERIRVEREAARADEAESRERAEQMRAEAEQARTTARRAESDARQAHAEAKEAQRARDALHSELMNALSEVLETRRQARQLVCNFSDVWFDFDTATLATLTPGGTKKLQKLAGVLLRQHDSYHVEIEGHTDAFGSDEHNLKLSQQRAEAVRRGLDQAGVDPERIVVARGVGSACPVASNDTREGRQLNRRVEIIITEGPVPDTNGTCQP